MRALLTLVLVVLATGVADAYPQLQLSRGQTCSSCHISPAGGGLLTENGEYTAEGLSALGTNPAFMYGAIDLPAWLSIGGDIRAQSGYLQAPQRYLVTFPMQSELYAAARTGKLTAYINVGGRPAQDGNESATRVWSREHYVMWQSEAGASEGLFVRAGHFAPVFGLRWVEHPLYTREYGGMELFSETYGVSASYIKERFEAHVTGFIENPLIDPVRQSNGGAAYGEVRLGDKTAVGIGGMFEHFYAGRYTVRGELTAKRLVTDDLLLQGELQVINPHVSEYGWQQLASVVMASYFLPKGILVDVGWNHYNENLRQADVFRDAFDLNVHWFATSHIELLLVNRLELMALGDGGPTGAWAQFQLHYRL